DPFTDPSIMPIMPVDADQVLETFAAATEENQLDPLRDQQVIKLPADGELWVAADMHDIATTSASSSPPPTSATIRSDTSSSRSSFTAIISTRKAAKAPGKSSTKPP